MTAIAPECLLKQITAFPIDEGSPDLTFEMRLACENGWPLTFARRVVTEDKRFDFLAMTTHAVTPSDQVDQAWHLHLTYSRSYWDRLCGEVLGRPLHHGPTRGGADEAAKFHEQYELTLVAYRTAFGEEPPADIWPPVFVRFGPDSHPVRVDPSRNWVLSKFETLVGAAIGGAVVAALAFVGGCGWMLLDPLGLNRDKFLFVLIPALVLALAVGRVLRWWVRGPGPQPGDGRPELDWGRAAHVAGGAARVASAALARLVGAGLARVSADGQSVEPVPGVSVPPDLTPAEREVWRALPLSRAGRVALLAVTRRVEAAIAGLSESASAEGYTLGAARITVAGWAAALPLLLVLFFLAFPRVAAVVALGWEKVNFLGPTILAALVLAVV